MATEWETEARAEIEQSERDEKVRMFLASGYANQVADLALAAYWDSIQARLKAERIGRDIEIDSLVGKLSRSDIRDLRAEQGAAYAEAGSYFRTAADFAAIAGAVALARTQRTQEV